jgi:hypothetical protein
MRREASRTIKFTWDVGEGDLWKNQNTLAESERVPFFAVLTVTHNKKGRGAANYSATLWQHHGAGASMCVFDGRNGCACSPTPTAPAATARTSSRRSPSTRSRSCASARTTRRARLLQAGARVNELRTAEGAPRAAARADERRPLLAVRPRVRPKHRDYDDTYAELAATYLGVEVDDDGNETPVEGAARSRATPASAATRRTR